jgi:hypothetical protein
MTRHQRQLEYRRWLERQGRPSLRSKVTDEEVIRAIKSVPTHYSGPTIDRVLPKKESASLVSTLQSSTFTGGDPSPGDMIVVVIVSGNHGPTVSSVTDTAGSGVNTYTQDKAVLTGTSNDLEIWSCANIGGTLTNLKITVNFTGNTYPVFGAIAVSGMATTKSIDTSVSNSGSSQTGQCTGEFTTSNASDLIVIAETDGANTSSGTPQTYSGVVPPYTNFLQETDNADYTDIDADYQIVSSIQTNVNPTWTLGVSVPGLSWAAVAVAYKATAAGTLACSPASMGAGTTNTLTLTGSGTNWTSGTPGSPTFTVSGGTITAQTVSSPTSATLTFVAPPSTGTVTLTDPSTGATATLTIVTPSVYLSRRRIGGSWL